MSTKLRNPRFFPTMKVRGARRRRRAPFERMARSFDQIGVTARTASRAFIALGAGWHAPFVAEGLRAAMRQEAGGDGS